MMRISSVFGLEVVVLLVVPALLAAAEPSAAQRARIENLEASLLAPCCYGEPVLRHQSEVAVQMRLEIAKWVEEGRTDRQIIDTYIQLYGARVYAPPKKIEWWVYALPFVAALGGLALAIGWLRRRLPPAGANA